MNAELEKWIEENTAISRGIKVVTAQDLRALFDGKVLVPASRVTKAIHALEHLKADIQERSKMQEDYQEGVVMVGAGAWHGLCSTILMLAASQEPQS